MLDRQEMRKIARARLKDAEVLVSSRRYEGAVYLCGYAVELGLKARICRTLKWQGYPSTNSEFNDYRSFKTHNLDILLHLTGIEEKIKNEMLAEWSAVAGWDSQSRYNPIGTASVADARLMIESASALLKKL